MDRRKVGIACWIAGGVLLCVGLIMIIAYFGINSNDDAQAPTGILIGGIVSCVIGLIVAVVGYICGFKGSAKLKAQWQASYNLPYQKITDFKAELKTVADNYTADGNPQKNLVPVRAYTNSAPLFDYAVLSKGKICYAYVLNCAGALTANENLASFVLPMEVLTSTDEYFESHPLELKRLAEKFREGNFYKQFESSNGWMINKKLPQSLTDGRDVYLTTVMCYRPHLPMYYLADRLLPVISLPENCTATFVVDCKYWSDNFIGNYCHRQFLKAVEDVFDL